MNALFQPLPQTAEQQVRALFFRLFRGQQDDAALDEARTFLEQQLDAAQALPSDLPDSIDDLAQWVQTSTQAVGQRYREYLDERKAGAPRRYFPTKSHALYFLKSVAPTKMVDGSWLYGVLQRWQDARFSALIKIYLEELGEGMPDKNHVVLYRKLIEAQGCDQWDDLSDAHYVQGALQLAFAQHAEHFLPELIGFNLGYEQLPLHLLITAYELNELGIDPYYFTLHITVDNADTGHARKSLEALLNAMPQIGDADVFYRRVRNGYALNELGASSTSIIASFDLEQELTAVFARKSVVGQFAHSDYCRVAGRTINDWLSDPNQVPAFLGALQEAGWLQRNHSLEDSRFWKLIQSERAEMFGVFNAYEQQVIRDWITGDMADAAQSKQASSAPRALTFRARQRLMNTLNPRSVQAAAANRARGILRRHAAASKNDDADNDFNAELRGLEDKLAASANKEEAMRLLTELMSPSRHHTAPGLMATRIFTKMLT